MNQEEFEQAFDRLTPRLKEVLLQLLNGKTDGAIASSLKIGEATVRKHVERICQAFGLENEHPDERRYKRDKVFALVGKYKPELLSDRTPVTANEVAVAETASTKDTSDPETVVTELPQSQSATLAGQNKDESDIWQQLPEMPQQIRELFLIDKDKSVSDEQKRNQFAKNLNKFGYKNYLNGNFQSAAFYLEWAIAFDPNFGKAHYNLGSTYEELRKLELARSHYQAATKCKGSTVDDAINNLARLEIYWKGNSVRAIELLLPSLERVKDASVRYTLHKNLGWAYFQQNQCIEAEHHLQKAIELDSCRADAYYLLAQVQEAQKDKQSAYSSWEKGLKYDLDKEQEVPWRLPELDVWRNEARRRLNALGN